MANPLPTTAHRLVHPETGIVTSPWQQWFASLVTSQGNAITWSTVSASVGFQNGWRDLDALRPVEYGTDDSGRIYLRGAMAGGIIGSAAFTLPSTLWPPAGRRFAVDSNAAYGMVAITSNGDVTPNVGSNVNFFFDGIIYSNT